MSIRMLPAALVVAGMAFGAHARTVSVAELSDDKVTFAFGAQDGNDYELIMAHGAQDREDDKRAWTAFEKVADVAWDQTTCTYEVPEALRDGRYLRFFLMQRSNLPYAKELKSVSSTGLQWVNTGVAPNGRTVVDNVLQPDGILRPGLGGQPVPAKPAEPQRRPGLHVPQRRTGPRLRRRQHRLPLPD